MLFNRSDLLITESTIKANSNVIDVVSAEESMFLYGLDCIRESNENIRNMMKNLYIESGFNINEGFASSFSDKFDFKNIIGYIIGLFVKMLTSIYNRFKAILLKLLYDNQTIRSYKDKIEKYSKTLSSQVDHFIYTYSDTNIPPVDIYLSFGNEYERLLDDLKKLSHNGSKAELLTKLTDYESNLKMDLNNGYYDNIRMKVLNGAEADKPIGQDQYTSALYRAFRNGMSAPVKYDISANEVHTILNRFLSSKDTIKNVEKSKRNTEEALDMVKKKIGRLSAKDVVNEYVPMDYDIEFALNKILKVKCGQFSECCNIYAIAFSSKVDAIKEAAIQDKKILFEVISDIIVSGGDK